MNIGLPLTEEEIGEATALLIPMVYPNKFGSVNDNGYCRSLVLETLQTLACIAQVVDNRKEKEIG